MIQTTLPLNVSVTMVVHSHDRSRAQGQLEDDSGDTGSVLDLLRAATVAELADAQDLGSCGVTRGGSSPSGRIHPRRQDERPGRSLAVRVPGTRRSEQSRRRPEREPVARPDMIHDVEHRLVESGLVPFVGGPFSSPESISDAAILKRS